jgi:prepilin-type N-terminal cleavage/methylation domain-containing protein
MRQCNGRQLVKHSGSQARGFSLIEMVISVGIASIVAVSSGYIMSLTAKEGLNLQSNLELDRLNRQVRDIGFRSSQSCTTFYSFPSPFPVGNAGPVDVPIRIQLNNNLALADNTKLLQYNLDIVSVEFARAQAKGFDPEGNRLYQGVIEIETRPANRGIASFTKRMALSSLMVKITPAGALATCDNGSINASQNMCEQLNLEYDSARQSCRFDADINGITPGPTTCDDDHALTGITTQGRLCNRTLTDYCTGNQFMTGLTTGRSICAEPPPEQVLPPATPPPTPPAPQPAVPQPSTPPPPAPGPPAAGATPPPVCAQTAAARQCQSYCFDFGYGNTCYDVCDQNTDVNAACGTVVVNPTPPPISPPPPTPPTDPRPQGGSCSCGGVTISSGQYCGYCYQDYEPPAFSPNSPDFFVRQLDRVFREESYQCVNGQLVYSAAPNPNRGSCRGEYEVW